MFVIVCSIMGMCCDCYVVVLDLFYYNNRIIVRRVKICMLGIWLNVLILIMFLVVGVRKVIFFFVYCYLYFFVFVVVLIIVYILIFKRLLKKF